MLLSTSSISASTSEKHTDAYDEVRLQSLQVNKIQKMIQRAQKGLLEVENWHPTLCTREVDPSFAHKPLFHEFKNSELNLHKMWKNGVVFYQTSSQKKI